MLILLVCLLVTFACGGSEQQYQPESSKWVGWSGLDAGAVDRSDPSTSTSVSCAEPVSVPDAIGDMPEPEVYAWYESESYTVNDFGHLSLTDRTGAGRHLEAVSTTARVIDGAVRFSGTTAGRLNVKQLNSDPASPNSIALTMWLVIDPDNNGASQNLIRIGSTQTLRIYQDPKGVLHFRAQAESAHAEVTVPGLTGGKQLIRMNVTDEGGLEAWVREEHKPPLMGRASVPTTWTGTRSTVLTVGAGETDTDAFSGKLWELVSGKNLTDERIEDVTASLEEKHFAGYVALAKYSAWVDAADAHQTVDAVTPALREGFAASHAVLSDIIGPQGEPGISIAESAGTTAVHSVYADHGITNLAAGYVDVRVRLRTYDASAADAVGSAAKRWRGPNFQSVGSSPYSTYMWMLSPAERGNPGTELSYRANNNRGRISAGIEPYDSDWTDIRFETHVHEIGTDVSLPNAFGFQSAGSITGNRQTVADIASAEVRQSRVREYVDHRNGTVVFTEESNAARLCVAPDLWMGSMPCFTEAWGSRAGATKITSSVTPAVVHMVAHFHDGRRAAVASNAITVGDVALQVGTDARWHLVQGATDIDTGVLVAPVPINVTLAMGTNSVQLWIDGRLQHTAKLTRSGSGVTVLGGRSGGSVQAIAYHDSNSSAAELSAVSRILRERAGLPQSWPLTIWTGQSNSYHDGKGTFHLVANGIRSIPGHANLRREYGGPVEQLEWRTGAFLDYEDAGRALKFGPSYGWHAAAQAAGRPAVIMSCGEGGYNLTQWLSGGNLYDYTRNEVDRSLAQFGSHLVHVDALVFIQGEADTAQSALASAYLDNLRAVRRWVREKWGPNVKWVGLRLNEFVGGGSQPFANDIRRAQDEFAAEDPRTVYITPDSNPNHFVDAVHYTASAQRYVVGEPLYAARQTFVD